MAPLELAFMPSADEVRAAALEVACRDGTNVMPALLDAIRAYATLGETCDVVREAFGVYQESAVL